MSFQGFKCLQLLNISKETLGAQLNLIRLMNINELELDSTIGDIVHIPYR